MVKGQHRNLANKNELAGLPGIRATTACDEQFWTYNQGGRGLAEEVANAGRALNLETLQDD